MRTPFLLILNSMSLGQPLIELVDQGIDITLALDDQ